MQNAIQFGVNGHYCSIYADHISSNWPHSLLLWFLRTLCCRHFLLRHNYEQTELLCITKTD